MEGASTSRNQRELRIDMDSLAVSAKQARYTISAGDGSVPILSSAISVRLSQAPRWGKPDQKAGYVHHPRRCGNILTWSVIERALFVATLIGYVVTMAIHDFRTQNFCALRAWRWATLIFTAFCGRLISKLIVSTILFLITIANISSETCLYYIKEIQKTLICVTWFTASLTTWFFIFDHDDIVDKTPKRKKMQWYVTMALVCLTISAILWLVKILVTKKLKVNRFKTIYFERLKSALFFQYVLETFIFVPANKMAKELVFAAKVPKKEASEELFVTMTLDEWDAIDAQNVGALTLMDFIRVIQHTTLHEYLGEILKHKTSISEESQCEQAAELMSEEIFNRISGNGVGITLSDIEQSMPSELAKTTFNLVPKQPDSDQISKEAATRRGKQTTLDSDQISKNDLKNWLVRGFKERTYLELSLSDTDGVLKHVRHLLNEVVWALMSLVWLAMFKNIGIMKFIFLELAQVTIITGCFVNAVNTTFQCLRFLFWHRPFDLGDTVTMNSITMVVEEIRLLTTIFKLPNGNKVTCSNSELVPDRIMNHNSKHDIAYAAEGISEQIEVLIGR